VLLPAGTSRSTSARVVKASTEGVTLTEHIANAETCQKLNLLTIHGIQFEEILSNFFAVMEDVFPGFTQLSGQEKVIGLILNEPIICKVSAKFSADIYEDRV
jgi:hypothetical protein